MKLMLFAVIAATTAGTVAGCGGESAQDESAPDLSTIANQCGATAVDDGTSIVISGEDGAMATGNRVQVVGWHAVYTCVALELNMPQAVQSRVSATTALQGRQEAEWESYRANWSYHPDNGLDMVITAT